MGLVKKKHKSGTPGPSASSFKFSDTIFVYAEATKGFWQSAQAIGKSIVRHNESLLTKDNYNDAGTALIDMGNAERKIEKKLLTEILKNFFPDDNVNIDGLDRVQYVNLLNKLLVGENQYIENLNRLRGLFSSQMIESMSWQKDKKIDKYHGYAPTISSIMLQVFVSACKDVSKSMVRSAVSTGVLDEPIWKDKIKNTFFKQLEEQLKKGNTSGIYEYLGGIDQWKETIDVLKQMDDFTNTLMVQGSADTIFKRLQSQLNTYIKTSTKYSSRDITKIINDCINVTFSRSATFGGTLGEHVNIAQVLQNFMGLTGSNIIQGTITQNGCKIEGKVFDQTTMKIDSMLLFSFGANCSFSSSNLNKYMIDNQPKGLVDAHEKMTKYLNKHKLGAGNFIIFQNAKTSGLGSSFKGFKGDSGKLEDIPDIGQDFLTAISNATTKGILQSRASQFIKALKIFILRKVATLLFDDVEVVGKQANDNRIHVLNLNNIIVPMSDVLVLAGQAMQKLSKSKSSDLTSYFNVTINLGTATKTSADAQEGKTDRDRKQNIIRLWNDNCQEIINNSTYTVHMLRGFSNYIEDFL